MKLVRLLGTVAVVAAVLAIVPGSPAAAEDEGEAGQDRLPIALYDGGEVGGGGEPAPEGDEPDIVGGSVADPDDYEWMTVLGEIVGLQALFQCGGTLVAPRVVVTAAHCTFSGSDGSPLAASDLFAGVGVFDVDALSPTTPEEGFLVNGLSRHPRCCSSNDNDIALLRLAGSASGNHPPLDHATPDDVASYPAPTLVNTAGWGATTPPFDNLAPGLQLREVDVPVVDDGPCTAAYAGDGNPNTFINAETMLCAGTGTVDSCFGDSGGPLTLGPADDPLLVGVVSWGPADDCANATYPGVYVEVAPYSDWIDAHIADTQSPIFTDVRFGHPFIAEIWSLKEQGVIGGYGDGSYKSANAVSRQAMAAFMYRLAGEPPFSPPALASFPDVPTDHPFFDEIEWMVDAEITSGYGDGTFKPANAVSRGAMSAFMYRLAGEPPFVAPGSPTFPDVPVSFAFFDEIEWMADQEITTGYGDGTFKPGAAVSRQSMAAFMYRLQPLLNP